MECKLLSGSEQKADFFSQFYYTHATTVYNIALRLTKCRQDADDLTQDVFLQCLCSRVDFENVVHVNAYLLRMTRNRFLDERRWQKREQLSEQEYCRHFEDLWPPSNPVEKDPACCLHLRRAIQHLPLRQKHVLILKHVFSLPSQVIASTMTVSPFTVKNHYAKSIKQLKKRMAPFANG